MSTRTNLATNPNFESGVASWTAQNGTFAASTAQAHSGTQSGLATLNAVASSGVFIPFTQVVGTVYTLSAWVYSPSTLTVRVAYTGGTVTGGGVGVLLAAGTWTRISVTGTATSTSGYLSVLTTVAPAAGSLLYIDDVLAEASTVLGPYFDGTVAPSAGQWVMWTGTVNASTSVATDYVSAVANASFSPPRNEITLSVTTGDVMKNPAVSRIINGVAQLIRQQPSAGLDTRTVYDYEAPRDVPCTYEFVTDYLNPSGTGAAVWDETWTSLSAWLTGSNAAAATTDTSFSVSGGKLVWTQPSQDFGGHDIYRTVTAGSYRVTIASMAFTNPGGGTTSMQVYFYPSPLLSQYDTRPILTLQATAAGTLTIIANYPGATESTTATTISTSSTITVDFLGTSISVSGSGGTWNSQPLYTTTNINQVHVAPSSTTGGSTFTVGEIKVSNYATVSTHVDQLSSPVTLSPAAAWLIHPSNPALSMPVSSHDRSAATIRILGEVSNASTVTEHEILGQQFPITTTSGPRQGNKLQAVVGVRTAAQEQALMGLLADGTPLLFRAPASYPIGLEEGFYSVGDVTRARISQRLGDPMRNFTLPLTQVQSPIVTVQNAGWSWAALAAAFPTWAAVAAAYNTWADVLTNNRKPGY